MRQNLNLKKDRGFTILEIIIATFILVTAIIASYSAFSGIITATSVISSRLTASYLTQEGIEIIRNIRDTNWLNNPTDPTKWNIGLTSCSSGCEADYTTGTAASETTPLRSYSENPLNIDAYNFYSYFTGPATKFKRKITVAPDPNNADILQVSVLIEWEDRGKSYNFTAEEYLYNWH